MRVSHRACPNCGRYNGKVATDVAAKAQVRAERRSKNNPQVDK
jgi:NMD protein affecting ribosome stability and mRNA decay